MGSWTTCCQDLPKESKSFMKARPIIAYTKCWHTKTSSFLATALFELMQVAFPAQSTWNTASVHKALGSAWRFIQAVEASCEALEMVQQDLIGFFNSVPHDRILQALDLLIWRLEELFHRSVNDIVFQVDMGASTKRFKDLSRSTTVSSICDQKATTLSCSGIDTVSSSFCLL